MERTTRQLTELKYFNELTTRFIQFISRHTTITLVSTFEHWRTKITNVTIITPETIYELEHYQHKIYYYKRPILQMSWHKNKIPPRLYLKHDTGQLTKEIAL